MLLSKSLFARYCVYRTSSLQQSHRSAWSSETLVAANLAASRRACRASPASRSLPHKLYLWGG